MPIALNADVSHALLVVVPCKLLPAGHIYDTLDGEFQGVRDQNQVSELAWGGEA